MVNVISEKKEYMAGLTGMGGGPMSFTFVDASTGEEIKYTRTSIGFDGSNDYLSVADSADWSFGSGNFTVEALFYKDDTDFKSYEAIVGQWPDNGGTSNNSWVLEFVGSGNSSILYFYMYDGSVINFGGPTLAKNQWYHVAVCRSGNNIKMWINGVVYDNSGYNYSGTFNAAPSALTIGGGVAANTAHGGHFAGNISNVRITKGTALYSSNTFNAADGFEPFRKLDSTNLLCCTDPTSVTGSIITPETISNNGASVTAAHRSDPFFTINRSATSVGIGSTTSYDVWPALVTTDTAAQTPGTDTRWNWDPYGGSLMYLADMAYHTGDVKAGGEYIPSMATTTKSNFSTVNNSMGVFGSNHWYGQAILFDGSNDDYRSSENITTIGLDLANEDWTVEFWCRLTSDNSISGSYWGCYLSMGWEGGSNTNSQLWFGIAGSAEASWGYDDKEVHMNLKDNSGNVRNLGTSQADSGYQTTTGIYNDNVWHHYACSHDASTNKYRFYIDGLVRNTSTFTGGLNTSPGGKFTLMSYDHGHDGNSQGFMKGYLQDVRVYKGACKYKKDVLRLFGKESYNAYQTDNKELDFGASSDYNIGTNDFTFEFFFKTGNGDQAADTYYQRVFMLDGPTLNATGNFQVAIATSDGSPNPWDDGTLNMSGGGTMCDGNWHHVAVVRNGSGSGNMKTYLDGTNTQSATYTTAMSPNSGSPRPRIGSYNGSQGRLSGSGHVNNVRLTIGQALYTSSFTRPTQNLTTTSQGATASNVKLLCCQGPSPLYAEKIASGTIITTDHGGCGPGPFYT